MPSRIPGRKCGEECGLLTDIVSVMNVISVSAVRINGGAVCCVVVADVRRVPVSFYVAAAGGKHGQQAD